VISANPAPDDLGEASQGSLYGATPVLQGGLDGLEGGADSGHDTGENSSVIVNASHVIDDSEHFTGSVAATADDAIHIMDNVASVDNADDDEHDAEDTQQPTFTQHMITVGGQLARGYSVTRRRTGGNWFRARRSATGADRPIRLQDMPQDDESGFDVGPDDNTPSGEDSESIDEDV
jgi:hypothetical protein